MRIVAIAFIVVGVLALVYGGFSYTRKTGEAQLGPLDITVKQNEWVSVPVWAGVGAIAIGGLLLVFGPGRKAS